MLIDRPIEAARFRFTTAEGSRNGTSARFDRIRAEGGGLATRILSRASIRRQSFGCGGDGGEIRTISQRFTTPAKTNLRIGSSH